MSRRLAAAVIAAGALLTPACSPPPRSPVAISDTRLVELCRDWRERLRLTNWAVTVTYKPLAEMDGTLGNVTYDPRGLTGFIVIARDMVDARYPDNGIEQTVIHELLHLHFHGHQDYKGDDVMEERAINCIADALYFARHPADGLERVSLAAESR